MVAKHCSRAARCWSSSVILYSRASRVVDSTLCLLSGPDSIMDLQEVHIWVGTLCRVKYYMVLTVWSWGFHCPTPGGPVVQRLCACADGTLTIILITTSLKLVRQSGHTISDSHDQICIYQDKTSINRILKWGPHNEGFYFIMYTLTWKFTEGLK